MKFMGLLLLVGLTGLTLASCPANCTCYLDQKGRISLLCNAGGIVGLLRLDGVSYDTEIINITAPDDNRNSLTMSPVFKNYKNLKEIHITKSNVPQLGMNFFYGLNNLDVLNLSDNNISQLLDDNFLGLSELKELYLDDNEIVSLPLGTFRHLHKLKVLSIQRNRIEELTPHIFLEISKLKVLKLSGNSLGELHPRVFKDVQELRSFECRGCGLVPKVRRNIEIFHLFPNLTHIDLGSNEITNSPSRELREQTHLKVINLDSNRITALYEEAFRYQLLLRKVILSRNQIETISKGAFCNLNNLTELDLGYNKIESIEFLDTISDTLEVLILSGNDLKPRELGMLLNLKGLKELRLAETNIVEISQPIFPSGLNILDLGGNHLSSLCRDLLPLNLLQLDISKNRFCGIDDYLIQYLENVQNLKMEDNPWSCDLCYIVPLLERVNRSAAFKEITCTSPFTVTGKKLALIPKNELTWCTSPSCPASNANCSFIGKDGIIGVIAAAALVCLFLLAVFAIIRALCYSKRHDANYYKLAMEGESIFDNNQSPLLCDGELNFKFPLDAGEKKISIATIGEIKKEYSITNRT